MTFKTIKYIIVVSIIIVFLVSCNISYDNRDETANSSKAIQSEQSDENDTIAAVSQPEETQPALETVADTSETDEPDFAYIMWFCCTQWAADDYTRYTLTNELKRNVYSLLDFSNYTDESISIATKSVNTVLGGTRVTSPTTISWVGDGKYNTFGD